MLQKSSIPSGNKQHNNDKSGSPVYFLSVNIYPNKPDRAEYDKRDNQNSGNNGYGWIVNIFIKISTDG